MTKIVKRSVSIEKVLQEATALNSGETVIPSEVLTEIKETAQSDLKNGVPVDIIIEDIYEEVGLALNSRSITSLEEARSISDAWLFAGGDWGGQMYFTIPASLVECSEQTVSELVKILDEVSWGCNDGDGSGFCFRRHVPGVSVVVGMGGAETENTLWVHDEFQYMKEKIQDILQGKAGLGALEPIIIPTPSLM